ncbi:MAG: thiamine ABC transporter substrate binding subunit [Alphaproteobacteria bacterium]
MKYLSTFMTFGVAVAMVAFASAAQAKETLTVYTYDAFAAEWGPGPAVKTAFEAECDCTLDFVALDSSVGILSRLKLEGASSPADVVLGLDTNLTVEAKKTGLLTKHKADVSKVKLPTGPWTDETFVPFDYGYFAFVYNSETVSDVPSSLNELVNADPKLKIVLQDPRSSTPGLGFLLWMKSVYGDDAPAAWDKLEDKVVTTTKSWSDAYFNFFLAGEADMVLSYTTSPAYHLIAENDPKFKAASFTEGHYMQVEVAAALKSSDTPELAQQFMQFILEDGFQVAIPTGNWMYPVTDVKQPDGFETLITPAKTLYLSEGDVNSKRRNWVDEWLDASSN